MGCTPSRHGQVVDVNSSLQKRRGKKLDPLFTLPVTSQSFLDGASTDPKATAESRTTTSVSLTVSANQSPIKLPKEPRDGTPDYGKLMPFQESFKEFSFKAIPDSYSNFDQKDKSFACQMSIKSKSNFSASDSRKSSPSSMARKAHEKSLKRLDTCGEMLLQVNHMNETRTKYDGVPINIEDFGNAISSWTSLKNENSVETPGFREELRRGKNFGPSPYASKDLNGFLLVVPEETRANETSRDESGIKNLEEISQNNESLKSYRTRMSGVSAVSAGSGADEENKYLQIPTTCQENRKSYSFGAAEYKISITNAKEDSNSAQEKSDIQETPKIQELNTQYSSEPFETTPTLPKSRGTSNNEQLEEYSLLDETPVEDVKTGPASLNLHPTPPKEQLNARKRTSRTLSSGITTTSKPLSKSPEKVQKIIQTKFRANLLNLVTPKQSRLNLPVLATSQNSKKGGIIDYLENMSNLSFRTLKSPPITNIRERDTDEICFKLDCGHDQEKSEINMSSKLHGTDKMTFLKEIGLISPIISHRNAQQSNQLGHSSRGQPLQMYLNGSFLTKGTVTDLDDLLPSLDLDHYTVIEEIKRVEYDESKGITMNKPKPVTNFLHPHRQIKKGEIKAQGELAKAKSENYDNGYLSPEYLQRTNKKGNTCCVLPSASPQSGETMEYDTMNSISEATETNLVHRLTAGEGLRVSKHNHRSKSQIVVGGHNNAKQIEEK